jgi:hypothetical protein
MKLTTATGAVRDASPDGPDRAHFTSALSRRHGEAMAAADASREHDA